MYALIEPSPLLSGGDRAVFVLRISATAAHSALGERNGFPDLSSDTETSPSPPPKGPQGRPRNWASQELAGLGR
jgi:hypothetical protein